MSRIPPEQLAAINKALDDASLAFLSLDGFPVIQINRDGRLLSNGDPSLGIDPTYETLTFTTYSELGEIELDEVESSGGAIQFGDRRIAARSPIFNNDSITISEVVGIEPSKNNTGDINLMTVVSKPSIPTTYFTLRFTGGSTFTMTDAGGSVGSGTTNALFQSTGSKLTIFSTSWFGTAKQNDMFRIYIEQAEFNVYRSEGVNVFGSYEALIRRVV